MKVYDRGSFRCLGSRERFRNTQYPGKSCEGYGPWDRRKTFVRRPRHQLTDVAVDLLEVKLIDSCGASDTTAIGLTFTLYFVLANPQIWERLKREIREKFKSAEDITGQSTEQLSFLSAVLQEGTRLPKTYWQAFDCTRRLLSFILASLHPKAWQSLANISLETSFARPLLC